MEELIKEIGKYIVKALLEEKTDDDYIEYEIDDFIYNNFDD